MRRQTGRSGRGKKQRTIAFVGTLSSLQGKAISLLVALGLAIVAAGSAVFLRVASRALYRSGTGHCERLVGMLALAATEPAARGDVRALRHLAGRFAAEQPFLYVVITDVAGQPLAHAGPREDLAPIGPEPHTAGAQHGIGSAQTPWPRMGLSSTATTTRVHNRDGQTPPFVETSAPIVLPARRPFGPTKGAAVSSEILGTVTAGLSLAGIERQVAYVTDVVTVVGAAVTVLILPMGWLIVRRIVLPINQLSRIAKHIARGEFDVRAKIRRRDEIGQLATAFNAMADKLARSQNQLIKLNAELEERVRRRTEQLRELAMRDTLTGLYNRRHFNEVLARRFAESQRYGGDLSVVMIDLDNLKRANDTFGHRAGDRLLILAATTIAGELRASDVAARFGGDEFVVLLPQTGLAEAKHLADRIVERFGEQASRQASQQAAGLSAGIASLRETPCEDPEELLAAADEALYKAKKMGKGRVVQASSPGHLVLRA